jgi:hypothetical protein
MKVSHTLQYSLQHIKTSAIRKIVMQYCNSTAHTPDLRYGNPRNIQYRIKTCPKIRALRQNWALTRAGRRSTLTKFKAQKTHTH